MDFNFRNIPQLLLQKRTQFFTLLNEVKTTIGDPTAVENNIAFHQQSKPIKDIIQSTIDQLQEKFDVNKQLLLSVPEESKQREVLSKELHYRLARLKSLLAQEQLLLFSLPCTTNETKLLQVKHSLQIRLQTSIDIQEKTMLSEFYNQVEHALQQIQENKILADILIPFHLHEIKYFKHRDYTILKEVDLSSHPEPLAQPSKKVKLIKESTPTINSCLNDNAEEISADIVGQEPIISCVQDEPTSAVTLSAAMPQEILVAKSMTKPQSENDSIAAHNQYLIEELACFSNTKPLEALNQPAQGSFGALSSPVSMQQQKKNIITAIFQKAHSQQSSVKIIDLKQITDDLAIQYKGTPYENLLNHMVHYDNDIKLASLLENNQRYMQSLISINDSTSQLASPN